MQFSTRSRPVSNQSMAELSDISPGRTSQPIQPSLLQLQAVELKEMKDVDSNRSSFLGRKLSLGRRSGPGQGRKRLVKKSLRESQMSDRTMDGDTTDGEEDDAVTSQENHISPEEAMAAVNQALGSHDLSTSPGSVNNHSHGGSNLSTSGSSRVVSRDSSPVRTPELADDLGSGNTTSVARTRGVSVLSLPSVVGDHDQPVFQLQKVDPTFTDSMGHFTRHFEKQLTNLNKKNSATDHCIEVYLMKSERKFFDIYTDAQLKKQPKERPLTGASLDYAVDDAPYNHTLYAPD